MADDKPKRKRPMKPKAGVIDLEATEIETGPAPAESAKPEPEFASDVAEEFGTADPLAEDPAPEADDPELFEAEPRSHLGALIAAGVAGAAIAISAFLILLASGLIPLGGGDAALGSRVAGLEARLQQATETPPPVASQPPADDSALRAELESLKQDVEALRAAPPPAAPPPSPVDESRLAELSARLDALAQASENRASTAAFDQLAARVAELSAQTSEARAPDPAVAEALAGAKAAATLAAVASLEGAVARGTPYAAALGAVRGHLPDADLAALEAGANTGVANAALLAGRLAAKLEKAPAPPSTAIGFVDRLAEGAKGLVRIRPVDGSVPEISASDPWSARIAVTIRLNQGDYAVALADWDKLDAAAKEASKAEADALKARLETETALDRLRAAALAGPKP